MNTQFKILTRILACEKFEQSNSCGANAYCSQASGEPVCVCNATFENHVNSEGCSPITPIKTTTIITTTTTSTTKNDTILIVNNNKGNIPVMLDVSGLFWKKIKAPIVNLVLKGQSQN